MFQFFGTEFLSKLSRILFYFHENSNKRRFIAKIHPPRLNGSSCGVFASRSPHRPNPFGLTIVKLDQFKGMNIVISFSLVEKLIMKIFHGDAWNGKMVCFMFPVWI